MIKIYFATIHPEFMAAYSRFGVFSASIKGGHADLIPLNLRDFSVDRHGSVDGYPYGGGDSMVMRPEPIRSLINFVSDKDGVKPVVVYTSPKGCAWKQQTAIDFAAKYSANDDSTTLPALLFICGRFAGVDQRVLDLMVDYQFTVGDFVVSGGELPCLLLADSILRNIPGVLGNQDSVENDSFSPGIQALLEYPVYTRPLEFEGSLVPDVLMSGHHSKIEAWKQEQSMAETRRCRPDLLTKNFKK